MAGGCLGTIALNDSEIVARLCFQSDAGQDVFGHGKPFDINPQTQKLRYEAIKMKDLRSNGFSVQRVAIFTRSDAVRHRSLQRSRKPRAKVRLIGAVTASTKNLRAQVNSTGTCLFDVFSKPVALNPGHSEIRLVGAVARSEEMKCRVVLVEIFGQVGPYRAIFNGGSLANWSVNTFLRAKYFIASLRVRLHTEK